MRVDWDYSGLAEAYTKRPAYASPAFDDCAVLRDLASNAVACDVGAGTGNLTTLLAARGLRVVACEPNADMRRVGRRRTRPFGDVRWVGAYAERMPLRSDACALVSFGSSLNVTERGRSLREAARILRPGGGLICAWNHRSLEDPLQRAIQEVIERYVPSFSHGTRRADQAPVIDASGAFGKVTCIEEPFLARTSRADCMEAWRTHLSLARQAGEIFPRILSDVWGLLDEGRGPDLQIPYVTRLWSCRREARRPPLS